MEARDACTDATHDGPNQILCMESLDDDKTWRDNDDAGAAAYEKLISEVTDSSIPLAHASPTSHQKSGATSRRRGRRSEQGHTSSAQ